MLSNLTTVQVRARVLAGVAELVAKCGGDYNNLFCQAGISCELLHTPEATFEHSKYIELLELAASSLNIGDFGLRLARLQGISVLGPVALIAQQATTIGEAIAAVARNFPYHSPGAVIILSQPTGDAGSTETAMACLRYELQLPGGTAQRQNAEVSYAIALGFLRLLSANTPADWRIHFAHPRGLPTKRYQKHLGCQVRFGQPFDALYFRQDILNLHIDGADPTLIETAQRFVSHVIARSPLDLGLQVETLLIRQLADGGCTLPRIARQLRLSPSSLQRRLRALGISFDDIADRLRKDRAAEYLRHTSMPLAQVGSLLGYSESSSFNRSCQRWFGVTPQTYRRTAENA